MSWIETIATWFAPAPPPTGRVPRRTGALPSRRKHPPKPARSRPKNALHRRPDRPGGQQVIAFHGTPSVSNTASIFRHGWIAGEGNGLADGVYFSQSLAEAKDYAGSSGVYLRCRINLGRPAQWSAQMQREYQRWCGERSVQVNNSAKTAFLRQRGYTTLVSGNVIVVLWPQSANPSAWKRKFREISIISIHRASDDARIRV